MRSLYFAVCLFSMAVFAQSTETTFVPSTSTSIAVAAPTAGPSLSQLVLLEQGGHVAHGTGRVTATPAELGFKSQAHLDAAVRNLLRLPSTRTFRVVWEERGVTVSIIVSPPPAR